MNSAEIGAVFSNREESLASLSLFALHEHDLQAIIDRVVESTCSIMELEYCMVMRLDREKNLSLSGGSPEIVRGNRYKRFRLDGGVDVGYALSEGEAIIVNDYAKENRFRLLPLLSSLEIRSGLHVLMGGTDRNYGVLSLYSTEETDFTEHDIHFIQILANIIGMSIERDNSTHKLQEANRQLKEEIERSQQYQREILKNDLMERWRIGQFLHDNLAQTLVSVKMMVDGIRSKLRDRDIDLSSDIAYIEDILDRGIDSVRNLTQEVVPVDVDEDGVAVAFEHLIKQVEKVHHVKCELDSDEVITRINDREVATNLYRVAQEAIKNAVIHGHADKIRVAVREDENHDLLMKIIDNGEGFDESVLHRKNGMGINIMNHRMELLGGTIDIESNRESDRFTTAIICRLPLENAK